MPSIADATLYQSASAIANGSGEHLFIGMNSGETIRRSLVRFDLSAVPAGSIVTGVTLTMEVNKIAGIGSDATLHRVTRDWCEGPSVPGGQQGRGAPAGAGDCTWSFACFDTTAWTNAGGDFVSAASTSQTISGPNSYTWEGTSTLIADVQSWVDAPATNFGFIVRGDEATPGNAMRLSSRENTDPARRPMLTVTFTPAAGCDDVDFNNNEVFPEDSDILDFFFVLAGGEC